MTYVDVRPYRLVRVHVWQRWHDGLLRVWQQYEGRWRGVVTPKASASESSASIWIYRDKIFRVADL